MPRKINLIVLHCSDNPNPNTDIADIRAFHTAIPPKGRGWADVGYHYFIRSDGLLQRGRSIDQAGAHAKGFNSNSIGICLNGQKHFLETQFNTLKSLLSVLHASYPDAAILPHSELSREGKTCPNFDVAGIQYFWKCLSHTEC